MAGLALICCVVNVGQASRVIRSASKYASQCDSVAIGKGAVRSRLLDFLHLNEVRKEIVSLIVDRDKASLAMKAISEELEFHKPGHGIAFSHPVAEFVCAQTATADQPESDKTEDIMYKIIYTIVDRGRAEDVIEAATKAGARGGTIVNARGAGAEVAKKLFSIEVEPEKEKVFVITEAEKKDAIVQSIRTHLNLDEPGGGILYVLDVSEAYGLHLGG